MNISNNDHKYNTTETTTYACEYHIIWCAKYRRSVLSPEIQERLKALIFQQQEAYQYIVREVESMPDHVHLLASVPQTDDEVRQILPNERYWHDNTRRLDRYPKQYELWQTCESETSPVGFR